MPWSAIPCGPGGGVYAPTSGGASADWNGSIISGNTDATQADDLVGNLHTASELSDGANPSIVGNAQLNNKSCKAGNWRWVPLGGEGTYALNDQQATLTQLFGSSNPTLGSHPSTAPTQDFALVKGSPAIQACQLANTPYSGDNFGSYQGGAFSGDQGGQTAPGVKGTNYCIGSFEYQ